MTLIELVCTKPGPLHYALERIDRSVGIAAAHARDTDGPGAGVHPFEPARLPLAAAVSVMVLADLLDPAAHARLVTPLSGGPRA